jgi:phosphatidylinositol 3-kinase
MAGDPSRDKDFSFARLCDLREHHVVLRMCVMAHVHVGLVVEVLTAHRGALEGKIPSPSYSSILDDPSLRHAGPSKP